MEVVPEKVPDTSVLKNAAEKINGSSKEIVQNSSKALESVPEFMKGKGRVPLDFETILKKDPSFQKTKIAPVKGATVYKKDKHYYHRDTCHIGKRAHLEVYNKRGIHLGEADTLTGELIKNTADPAKTLYLK